MTLIIHYKHSEATGWYRDEYKNPSKSLINAIEKRYITGLENGDYSEFYTEIIK